MPNETTISHAFVDCFESDLSKRDHGNHDRILAEVRRGGRFSTFEMTATLMRTLNDLVSFGRIEEIPSGYPWHRYRVKEPAP